MAAKQHNPTPLIKLPATGFFLGGTLAILNIAGTAIYPPKQWACTDGYCAPACGKPRKGQTWFTAMLVRGTHLIDRSCGYSKIPLFVVTLTDPLRRYVLRTIIYSSIFNGVFPDAWIDTHPSQGFGHKISMVQEQFPRKRIADSLQSRQPLPTSRTNIRRRVLFNPVDSTLDTEGDNVEVDIRATAKVDAIAIP